MLKHGKNSVSAVCLYVIWRFNTLREVRRWTVLEGNWSGRGDALEGGFDISDQYDDNIRDFAVDEDDRTIIATPRFSILTVRGMKDNRLLWNISGVCFRFKLLLLTLSVLSVFRL